MPILNKSSILHFLPKSPIGVGVIKLIIDYRCYISNLVKIGPVALEHMLTKDARQRTVGATHLSNSGDLKTSFDSFMNNKSRGSFHFTANPTEHNLTHIW